jgi:prepilin-type N-terminal cleavage/methylation domain-containing protein
MPKRKRALTLLEVMIAMSLLAIILFFVLSPFKEIAILSGRVGKASEGVLSYHRVQTKLTRLFSQLEDEFHFENGELTCSSKIGVDPNPNLSSSIQAAILVDKEQNLVLEIWPKEDVRGKSAHIRREVLCKNVSSLHWQFFQLEEGKFETRTSWKETTVPDCIKLRINNYEIPFTIAKKTEGILL